MLILRLAYKTGAKQANDLDYASLPDSVVEQVRAAWKTNIKDSSGKPAVLIKLQAGYGVLRRIRHYKMTL